MKGRLVLALAVLISLSAVVTLTGQSKPQLRVYLVAAAKKVWNEILPVFEKEYGIKVEAIYGSSGRLLAQLEITRRGDVFTSASPYYMTQALRKGLVENAYPIACYVPAIIVRKDSDIRSLNDLLSKNVKIALCDTQSCAVGKFVKKMLIMNGLWDKIKGKVVTYTENFVKLIAVLLAGKVDAIIGWNIAHYWYPNQTKLIPLNLRLPYLPCIYVAKVKGASPLADKFLEFLNSTYVKEVFFKKYHYMPPG